jgi:four helix bundle protein
VQYLHTPGPVAVNLSAQLLECGHSAAANYEEADDGSRRRDRIAKTRIVLRELKETRLRLRVLRESGIRSEAHDPLMAENGELVKIVATIIRNAGS